MDFTVRPPTLADLDINVGKRVRMHRLLYGAGSANGTLLILPIDQGLEHGPMDFFDNPPSVNPRFMYELAVQGGYSAIALHVGLAKKYMKEYAGRIPLVLKLNGKTCVPSEDEAFSPLDTSVEEAVQLGADAVGYTLFIGSPSQDRDIAQFTKVRQDAERLGIPVIMWAYPRGKQISQRGGKDTLWAIEYAARVANELGADVVKVNFPHRFDKEKEKERYDEYTQFLNSKGETKPYIDLEDASDEERMKRIVDAAGNTMLILSGGSVISDEEVVRRVKLCLEQGAVGFIFGRNMWQRELDQALQLTHQMKDLLSQHSR